MARSSVRVVYDHFPALRADLRPRAGQILDRAALRIETGAKARVPVDTGTLRRSIHTTKPTEMSRAIGPSVEYGKYVEWGTHRMAARPYMTPAAEAERPRFVEAMKKLLA